MRRLVLLAAALALALPATAGARTYYGTVGPGKTITLKRADGSRVSRVPRGLHTFVIRDRSARHNFHLLGGGLHRRTGVVFTGRRVWKDVRIRAGVTYTFFCEPHPDEMRGTFRGV